ncbi:excinuclease ABC subunit B [Candidatus Marinamargulisbacteria bacterium SCGC AG-414-C22]|nr:excinuclease ABC subunit B [Candidatus Marinamargulisbacteria bacterium SCGC AG-414-C22]
MDSFKLKSDFKPAGDQPEAIEKLTAGLKQNKKHQVLLGATGSGKTFTIANVIQNINKPTLIMAHNKTLAAQLCSEFQHFFPDNAVEYFISYYDYYQPEAYIASRDAYIEKEADINEEIERLRHRATRSLLLRNDVIIVASVSCIYGLGLPEDYLRGVIDLKQGTEIKRSTLLHQLEQVQYERNDFEIIPGRYRIKGETIDIYPSWEEHLYRLEFFGDELEEIRIIHPITHELISKETEIKLFPATHYVVNQDKKQAIKNIREELKERLTELEKNNQPVEAHRLKQRTHYDLEMMEEMGYCKGIENYSRHLSYRKPGEAPGVLIDFFPDDFLCIVDESHVTIPQIGGMYKGDQSRKQSLVDYGFRLPSAKDNRPLQFHEFENKIKNCIYVSATPGQYELNKTTLTTPPAPEILSQNKWAAYDLTEQIIRPTGLIDPTITIKPTDSQINDVLAQIKERVAKEERVLVTTLTKQMSEDLTEFIEAQNIKVQYLHSDIGALERVDILRDLRIGKYDVLIGVNLLREGLDLPEVSLVIILDADKEGFLRNERSLIQTMGRAARHVNGTVILYADKLTNSMQQAINETNRRRNIQVAFNKKHNIIPQSVSKKIADIRDETREVLTKVNTPSTSPENDLKLIKQLEKEMKTAAANLEFECAAVLRDHINKLKEHI